ncbi:trypsin-like peptidase domain-containing protein [Thalassotalea sediminis]|uniref:trypsin-like peptidase domain-containing protein n=1 Tax=Thalassotalea sediminis TaxID=1759089 RepID=UPI002573D539|nr:trypsin-like peptidase domain-containing protein [Thalassotalea sediminis]
MQFNLKHIIITSLLSYSLLISPTHATQYSGINKLTFHNAANNKHFVGNGFLLKHNNKLYAVTVKHTLLEAKTPEMKTVSIKNHIRDWRIHPNQSPDQYVKLGKLLNADGNEAINMKILEKDWLVFEVIENKSPLAILTLRSTPVPAGETLTAYGCSYVNQETCQQDIYTGTFLSAEPNNLRIAMPNLTFNKLSGLSGSPVLDNQGQVVGIVSNIMKSSTGEGFDFAPANLKYLKTILADL